MDQDRLQFPHPYTVMKATDRDQWIDRFRNTLLREEGDVQILLFLAKSWHFLDRSTPTEECRIKRQCFIDLLICCGVWENEVFDRSLLELLRQDLGMSTKNRLLNWLRSLSSIRVSRVITPK